MTTRLVHAVVQDHPRTVIHVVRIVDEILEPEEIRDIEDRMRQRALARHGEQAASVVVVQRRAKETLRLFGEPHCVSRVRTVLFNAAVSWSPIVLD